MPTYEYRCDACSHEFEEFQYIKDEPLKKCPTCGKKKLRRLISGGAAIVFKGSGFYQTDYRSDAYKKGAKSDSAPTLSPTAASTSTTPTTPTATPVPTSAPAPAKTETPTPKNPK